MSEFGHASAADEPEPVANLAQDSELERGGLMQAHEHQALFASQLAEEIQHEADVSVLGIELRLVEKVDDWIGAARRFKQEWRPDLAEAAHLVGLMVVNGQPVALAVADAPDVLPGHHDAARGRRIRTRDHLEQRGLAGAVGSHDADDLRPLEGVIDLQLKGWGAVEEPAAVDLAHLFQYEQRHTHHGPPSSWRRRPGSPLSTAAWPAQATWPCARTTTWS